MEPNFCFLCCDADSDVRDACCNCSCGVHPRCLARLLMLPGSWTYSARRGLRAAAELGLDEARPGVRAAERRTFWGARRGARFRLACDLHGEFEQMLQAESAEERLFYCRYNPRAAIAYCRVCRAPFRSAVGLYYVDPQLTPEGLLVSVVAVGTVGIIVAAVLAFHARLYWLFTSCAAGLMLYMGAALAAAVLVHGECLHSDTALISVGSTLHFGVVDSELRARALRAPRNMGAARPPVPRSAPAHVECTKLVGPQ